MPKPQISDDNTAFLNVRLTWLSNLASIVQQVLHYSTASSVAVEPLLHLEAGQFASMSPQPDFCAAVLGREVDQWHIHDQRKRVVWMLKVGVGMDWLPLRISSRHWRQS